ncbi:hypothetical protein HGH93_21630 [Chitinophaga polysaccharea]|uniref:hypothetical protein n=1 Tax=Chitinophaga polysaccharea TaxID=1293035 RepID=UPI0014559BCE|nr:hypothetical protein [Chitinophaga polysaccharea]NLR60726.1 hypothetical protein [Chitinophaga polysaccharea]
MNKITHVMEVFQIEVNDQIFEVKVSLRYDDSMNFEVSVNSEKVVFAADNNGDISPVRRSPDSMGLLRAIGDKIESHYL